jgi:hypothetical protein
MIGDSIIVVRHLVYKSLPKDLHLNRLLCHTLLEVFFEEVKFFHVLNDINRLVYVMVDKHFSLSLGCMWKNREEEVVCNLPYFYHPPSY